MIGVVLQGRLGNQLFQYAFAYAASKSLNTKFYIDQRSELFVLPKYFSLVKEFNFEVESLFRIKGFRNIFSHRLKMAFYSFLPKFFKLKPIEFSNGSSPEMNLLKLKDQILYTGFFQSEIYFANVKEEIGSLFNLKEEFKDNYQKVVKNFPADKKVIAVHIRKGDYINLGWALSTDYYHKILQQFEKESSFFVFLSDEPATIAEEFSDVPHKYISNHEEIIDFQFLLNADVCILANSSFSWWGAFLNKKQPQIYAPKFWLGQNEELPNSIIPKNWIKC
ncbi:alpha-1,2-fucosyltransferase [Pedobacter sp. 22226]|uniref:alpha-1,2-fucosyltransferase n=1 Tax=Pedobacter sp. 22226 TaxID=3453894 RepID=UPI003F833D90